MVVGPISTGHARGLRCFQGHCIQDPQLLYHSMELGLVIMWDMYIGHLNSL